MEPADRQPEGETPPTSKYCGWSAHRDYDARHQAKMARLDFWDYYGFTNPHEDPYEVGRDGRENLPRGLAGPGGAAFHILGDFTQFFLDGWGAPVSEERVRSMVQAYGEPTVRAVLADGAVAAWRRLLERQGRPVPELRPIDTPLCWLPLMTPLDRLLLDNRYYLARKKYGAEAIRICEKQEKSDAAWAEAQRYARQRLRELGRGEWGK